MSSSSDPTGAAYKSAVENLGLKSNIARALDCLLYTSDAADDLLRV